MAKNFTKIFGDSKLTDLNTIDQRFKFHKISVHRTKKKVEIIKTSPLKTMLESTNISTKQSSNLKKNQKNHKRYGSTEQIKTHKKSKIRGNSMGNLGTLQETKK